MAISQKLRMLPLLEWRGFSLPELMVVVAVLGILAAIGVPIISGLMPSSEGSVAQRNLNLVNGALHNFKQAYWEISLAANAGSADELAIFRSLQFRDPVAPLPGTPFLSASSQFTESSSEQTYRAYWNGMVFRMYPKGAAGTGFDLLKMSGTTNAYVSTTNGPAVGPP